MDWSETEAHLSPAWGADPRTTLHHLNPYNLSIITRNGAYVVVADSEVGKGPPHPHIAGPFEDLDAAKVAYMMLMENYRG